VHLDFPILAAAMLYICYVIYHTNFAQRTMHNTLFVYDDQSNHTHTKLELTLFKCISICFINVGWTVQLHLKYTIPATTVDIWRQFWFNKEKRHPTSSMFWRLSPRR